MPTYTYEALNKTGQQVSGSIVGNDEQEAKRMLQVQGLFISKLTPAAASLADTGEARTWMSLAIPFRRSKVKQEKIVDFLRQLATLTEAKLPLVRSLTALIEQEEDKAFRPILEVIRERVQGGSTLADAFAQYPACFTRLAVNMVKAGEMGGVLETTLNRLADFTEEEQDL